MPISDVMSDDELRRRYDALPPIVELMGERTFLSRCGTWELFVERAPIVSRDFRHVSNSLQLRQQEHHPELYALIVEAFLG